jgi:hypothetical protein
VILAAAAIWLLHPFATGKQIGAGDALWYANMLADFVLQLRAGIFPIFAGQTIHAFNGAIYPLRVCPLYQHLAGLLDVLTLHRLGFFALQHFVVIVCGSIGIFACYFTLAAVGPNRRWTATLLSILYLGCPGILALVYTQDLYMTVPILPFAVYGIVRTFRRDNITSQVWMAAPLAALWWGHSPIAMWTSFAAAFLQITRILVAWRRGNRPSHLIVRAATGAAIFAVLVQYPFVSVASVHAPGTNSPLEGTAEDRSTIAVNLRSVFPSALLPVSERANELGDLQLGYGLWAVLILSIILASRSIREPSVRLALRLLLVSTAGFLLLLAPIPGLNTWLWAHIPEAIVRITFYWPMQRFYPIIAALIVFGGQLALTASDLDFVNSGTSLPGTRHWFLISIVGASCIWSLWESRQFIRAGADRTASSKASEIALRPENILLMNHSYGLFPVLPPYFSNGVMDPEFETRLLTPGTFQPLSPPPAPAASWLPWRCETNANPGILDLSPSFHLKPGHRYQLDFQFSDRTYHGVLELRGHSFFRQYSLPISGQPKAFGSNISSSHTIPLWTTESSEENVAARFIPTQPGEKAADYFHFGNFSFREISQSSQPIRLEALVPLLVKVNAPVEAWLETPRAYLPGYVAQVDGRNGLVLQSPGHLAMVPVTPSTRFVELRYQGSTWLRISYWSALACWAALASFPLSRKIAARMHPCRKRGPTF